MMDQANRCEIGETGTMTDAGVDVGTGVLLIISGPSGVGKTTITHAVREHFGDSAAFSVSVTTHPKTEADVDGVDYTFIDDGAFDRMVEADELLEWADVFGKRYGTPAAYVDERLDAGKLVLLEIDVQGAEQVRAKRPDALGLFILPPSDETLLRRLRDRKREDEAQIKRRFAKAKDEIARARAGGVYDHYIVNDSLDEAIERAIGLVRDRLGACKPG